MATRVTLVLLAGILAALLLAACGAHRAAPAKPSAWQGRFPAPAELARRQAAAKAASACESVAHAGAAYDLSLPLQNAAPGFGGALFSPATVPGDEFNTMAYAIYLINGLAYDGPAELRTYWDGPLGAGDLWIGLADFSGNHWDWFNPATPASTRVASFGLLADHRNAVGTVIVAVVLLGADPRQLNLLRLGPPDLCGALQVTPEASVAPTTKQFDLSGLSVAGDTFVDCEWDFENDGTVDAMGLGAQSHAYAAAGDYTLRLTLRTAYQETLELLAPLTVLTGLWEAGAAAEPASGLLHYHSPRLGLAGGVPLLACVEVFDGDPPDFPAYETLKLLAADDALAHSWHSLGYPAQSYTNQAVYSIVEMRGQPYILASALMSLTPNPQFLYPLDESLAWWGNLTFADNVASNPNAADMALVGGNLCIAYRDPADRLMFRYADGMDISQWSPSLDTTWGCNGDLALADVNGLPAIACQRWMGVDTVAYLLSSTPTGDLGSWNSYYTNALQISTPDLAWINGLPVLVAHGGLDFLYAAGDAPLGLNVWREATPSGGGGLGAWCSIGGPSLDGAVFVAAKTSAAAMGSCFVHDDGFNLTGSSGVIDALGGVDLGGHCSALCVGGVPMVAYEDATNDSIRFAVMR